MPPKAFITGGTGFIGSHLSECLIRKGWIVTCWTRPTSRTEHLENLGARLVSGEIHNQDLMKKAVKGQDYIFHLAARIRSASKKVFDLVNVQFTRNLLDACIAVNPDLRRFIYVSSIAAGGPTPGGEIMDESSPPAPVSEYGRTKLKGEELVRNFHDRIPFTIIRPPNVYGPGQQETELLLSILKRRIVPLLRKREAASSLIYVQDLVDGIHQAAESSHTLNRTYYLTDGKSYSWREILLTMKTLVPGSPVYFPLPEFVIRAAAFLTDTLKSLGLVRSFFGRRAWNAMVNTSWVFSPEKAAKDFGFQAKYSLEEGLLETIRKIREETEKRKSH